MAHTPGKWVWDGRGINAGGDRLTLAGVAIAMSGSKEYMAEAKANSILVAAAPELLASLKDLLNAIGGEDSTDIWCVSARAAIAAAEES